MKEDIIKRLLSFGYSFNGKDTDETWLLDFIIDKTVSYIVNFCHLRKKEVAEKHELIPEELRETFIDMVVGDFLLTKKTTGKIEGFDLSLIEKQISIGDTSITFGTGESNLSPEQRLDVIIDKLTNRNKELMKFRRIVW